MSETGFLKSLQDMFISWGIHGETLLPQLVGPALHLVTSVALALLILCLGWILSRLAARGVRRLLSGLPGVDSMLQPFLAMLVRYTILILTLVLVLSQFGVQTASIITVLGAAGLAVGLALQGTLQDIAAGIMLLLIRPFSVDDYIESGSHAGKVREMGLFTSILETLDGLYLSVPNNALWNTAVTNYSRNPLRRSVLEVGISYDDDPQVAVAALHDMLQADPRVMKQPEPEVFVVALADSSVTLSVRFWTENEDAVGIRYDILRQIKETVEASGCSIPYPQRVLHMVAPLSPSKA